MSKRLKSLRFISIPAIIKSRVRMVSSRKFSLCSLLFLPVAVFAAAAPPWSTKTPAEWTPQDAYSLLSDSPWVVRVTPTISNGLTQFQRRDGGDFGAQGGGEGQGVGLGNTGGLLGTGGARAPKAGQGPEGKHVDKMLVRWESALPVRTAEIKANEQGTPELDGEDYAIAVYGVNLKTAVIELKGLEHQLKETAMLQIEGKKDVKPNRVAALEMGGGMATIVYFFPRSAHLTAEDKRITFRVQIGRIFLANYFYIDQMMFQGKLAL